jgi:hypothetical protein
MPLSTLEQNSSLAEVEEELHHHHPLVLLLGVQLSRTAAQLLPSKHRLFLSEVPVPRKLEAVVMELFLEHTQMKAVVSSSLQDTQAVTLTTSLSEASPSQPVMSDQPSLELRVRAMGVSSNGEKTSPGTQALEPEAPITVRGTEIRRPVLLQAAHPGHPPFQIRQVEELTVGLTTEIRGDPVLLDTVFPQIVSG